MNNNQQIDDDFKIYYILRQKNHTISCSTYILEENYCYYNIKSSFYIFNYNQLNIIDKLNLKKVYGSIFKELILKKYFYIQKINEPIKKSYIPKNAKINKLYMYTGFIVKRSGLDKYHKFINQKYLKLGNIKLKDIAKMDNLAKNIISEDYFNSNCIFNLEDGYYMETSKEYSRCYGFDSVEV